MFEKLERKMVNVLLFFDLFKMKTKIPNDFSSVMKTQDKRVRKLVKKAYKIPFYRERFDRAGVKPRDIRCGDDLSKLPLLTKDELRAWMNEEAKKPKYENWFHDTTSGSSGVPLMLLVSPREKAFNMANWFRVMMVAGYNPFLGKTMSRKSAHSITGGSDTFLQHFGILRRGFVSQYDPEPEMVKQINAYNPVFLQSDEYTPSMIEFYMRAAIDREHIRNGVDGIEDLTDRQILQILRYLKKHPDEGHYYCDYLSACARLGEYLFGLTPDIPIREAHDRTVERIEINRDRIMQEQFAKAVSSREYRDLATCFTQEDEERFEDDPFIVTVPTQIEDLYAESENMHNCVRIYVSRVASKNARIYFLRKKDEPDKSYGTLEVSHDGEKLCQAKAFANGRLPMNAQRFVVRWCRAKGIKIGTWDIANQAQAG